MGDFRTHKKYVITKQYFTAMKINDPTFCR